MRSPVTRLAFSAALLLFVVAATPAFAQTAPSPPPASGPVTPPSAPAVAPTALAGTVTVTLGDQLESCVDRALTQHFMLFQQRFGSPESQRDTVVTYNRERQTIHLAMYGSAETSDDAKKRLESRKPAVDFAVSTCAKRLGQKNDDVMGFIELTYSQLDREKGKQKPLLRWYRGRWELL
jgi:hypothetical protein